MASSACCCLYLDTDTMWILAMFSTRFFQLKHVEFLLRSFSNSIQIQGFFPWNHLTCHLFVIPQVSSWDIFSRFSIVCILKIVVLWAWYRLSFCWSDPCADPQPSSRLWDTSLDFKTLLSFPTDSYNAVFDTSFCSSSRLFTLLQFLLVMFRKIQFQTRWTLRSR